MINDAPEKSEEALELEGLIELELENSRLVMENTNLKEYVVFSEPHTLEVMMSTPNFETFRRSY